MEFGFIANSKLIPLTVIRIMSKKIITLIALCLSEPLGQLSACIVCGAEAGQKSSDAASMAILFLLVVLLIVAGGLGSFVYTIAARSRRCALAENLQIPLEIEPQHPSKL